MSGRVVIRPGEIDGDAEVLAISPKGACLARRIGSDWAEARLVARRLANGLGFTIEDRLGTSASPSAA